MPSKRLTRKGFVAWLRSLPLDEPLPQPIKGKVCCPLEAYSGRKGTWAEAEWDAQALFDYADGTPGTNVEAMRKRWRSLTPRDCLGVLGEKV